MWRRDIWRDGQNSERLQVAFNRWWVGRGVAIGSTSKSGAAVLQRVMQLIVEVLLVQLWACAYIDVHVGFAELQSRETPTTLHEQAMP